MDAEFLKQAVLSDVYAERYLQDQKWGLQRHAYPFWLTILMEEVGEAAQAIQKDSFAYKASDANNLYKELVQVAAVAVAIAEQVKDAS